MFCQECNYPRRTVDGVCDCVNPMADFDGLMTAILITCGPEEEIQIRAKNEQLYQERLAKLYPNEDDRKKFLSKPRPELAGLSIQDLRKSPTFGGMVSHAIVDYLAGKTVAPTDWSNWLEHAVGGYFFPEEATAWYDSPNELLGGKTNREIAETSGGRQALTMILWHLISRNPRGKNMPHNQVPAPKSRLQEEMELDEAFPESVGWEAQNAIARAENRRRRLDDLPLNLLFLGLVALGILLGLYSCGKL